MLDPDMPVQAAAGGHTAIAFARFEHIAARDPEAVARKDDAIAVFRECMEAVGHRADTGTPKPRPIRLGGD